MDFVFWIILIVVLAAVAWWLVKRSGSSKASGTSGGSSTPEGARSDGALSGGSAAASAEAAGTTGIASAAGFGRAAEPAAPTTADEPAESSAASSQDERRRQDQAEWETQWSETSGSSAVSGAGAHGRAGQESLQPEGHSAGSAAPSSAAPAAAASDSRPAEAAPAPAAPAAAVSQPVHHPEYTEPHAPTLPGAETAALEDAEDDAAAGNADMPAAAGSTTEAKVDEGGRSNAGAGTGAMPASAAATETAERTQSSALVETGADHVQEPGTVSAAEPSGHLAAEEPYGAGSAAAGADGSGPADYSVKGDAGAMVYYEEGHPDYEQTRADVWFESAAHAEAAGFRAPRRKRL
ncbi:hypothetical protein D7Z96_03600 [Pseudarthrobacter phenanthrenivorans]|uniref:Uncharacterized protein n=1 Tax=Pseudarthrobacter phenanthrenivorans TaxID=361575 RepID=A0A3B0FJN6_PSEPS|nr:hypothetical protein [Pseudarthrobacter phenanthrenivorans]RKO26866.1 hypothetical protein D7Z96_03600 [Pseudarthrobacter phenanthrenivorans]